MWKTEMSYRALVYQKTERDLFSLLSIFQLVTILKVKNFKYNNFTLIL